MKVKLIGQGLTPSSCKVIFMHKILSTIQEIKPLLVRENGEYDKTSKQRELLVCAAAATVADGWLGQ